MKKKKLVIFLLVAMMVLSLALTALVGCKPDDDDTTSGDVPPVTTDAPEGYKAFTGTLSNVLNNTVLNAADGNLINNLKASAQLRVKTNYGTSENEYLIKFGASLAFNIADDNVNNFGLSIVDVKANNANILNVYYLEDKATLAPEGATGTVKDWKGNGNVYVDLGSGDNAQHLAINGLSIKSILRNSWMPNPETDASGNPIGPDNVRPSIDDNAAGNISTSVIDAVTSTDVLNIFDMVGGMGKIYQSDDSSKILVNLNLAKLLEDVKPLLDGMGDLDSYFELLNLDMKFADIATILPALNISLEFNTFGAEDDNWDDASLIGVNAKLEAAKKDFVINKTDGTPFIRLNIANDFTADVNFEFKFGANADAVPRQLVAWADYTTMNALNFTAKGELKLNEDFGIKISDKFQIAVPAGEYNIDLAMDADPVMLIGKTFNINNEDKINSIVKLVEGILTDAVKYIKIEITPKDTANETKLLLQVKNNMINADFSLVGLAGVNPLINNKRVSELVNIVEKVMGFLGLGGSTPEASATADNETASGDDAITATLKMIGGIVKNVSIVASEGKFTAEVKNQVVGTSEKDGKEINTTLDIKAEGDKTGLNIDAVMNNINIEQNLAKVIANIKVNSEGVTITAKTENLIVNLNGEQEIKADLVLKLTEIKLGNAK